MVAVAFAHPSSDCPCDEAARRVTRGVARGDACAVAEFYAGWFDFALRCARRASGRDESFGLDVAQDVMIRAARSMPALDSHAGVERWVSRVVCNAVVDRVRSERRRAAREGRACLHGDCGADAEAEQWVREQLKSLRDEDAILVRLRFGGAMKLREVGEAVNMSADAVRGRLRAAMGALRERVGQGDGHER